MIYLSGERVELHALEDEDAVPFAEWINEGISTEHLFTGSYPSRAEDVLAQWEKEREHGDVLFGIHVEGGFRGTCGLHDRRDIYRNAEARFIIADPGCIGKGYGTEVTRLLVRYGFERLNLHRVHLGVNADNERAVRCYLKCGFVKEGRHRDAIWARGKWHDSYSMSILKPDWEKQKHV